MGLCMESSFEHDAWKEGKGSNCPNRRGEALLAAGTLERILTWHQEILTLLPLASKELDLSDHSGFLPSSVAPPPSHLFSLPPFSLLSLFPSFPHSFLPLFRHPSLPSWMFIEHLSQTFHFFSGWDSYTYT